MTHRFTVSKIADALLVRLMFAPLTRGAFAVMTPEQAGEMRDEFAKIVRENCGDECLAKVSDIEPIFVLRAQDANAPGIVSEWANRLSVAVDALDARAATLDIGAELLEANRKRHAKIDNAYRLAGHMRAWSPRRLPD